MARAFTDTPGIRIRVVRLCFYINILVYPLLFRCEIFFIFHYKVRCDKAELEQWRPKDFSLDFATTNRTSGHF